MRTLLYISALLCACAGPAPRVCVDPFVRMDGGAVSAEALPPTRGLDALLVLEIEATGGELVLGYRAVRVACTRRDDGLDTSVDVAFGGPCLGLSFGF